MEYHGRLSSVDSYMNVKLTNTEEWKDGKNEGVLGEVFIRYVPSYSICTLLIVVVIMCFGSVSNAELTMIACNRIEHNKSDASFIQVSEGM
jgi:LSM domain